MQTLTPPSWFVQDNCPWRGESPPRRHASRSLLSCKPLLSTAMLTPSFMTDKQVMQPPSHKHHNFPENFNKSIIYNKKKFKKIYIVHFISILTYILTTYYIYIYIYIHTHINIYQYLPHSERFPHLDA